MSYGYDPLQRVASANSCGSTTFPKWGLSESFDRYGNRWNQTLTAGSGPPTMSLAFGANGMGSSTTNRPNGYNYDSSGNMTVEPLVPQQNYMTYDGENRMTAVTGGGGGSYAYDGNGTRVVRSVTGGATTVSIFAGGSVIAEYDNGAAPSAPSREYIYNPAGGDTTGLLAMIVGGTTGGGATTYYHQDHLSVRLTTDGTPAARPTARCSRSRGAILTGSSGTSPAPATSGSSPATAATRRPASTTPWPATTTAGRGPSAPPTRSPARRAIPSRGIGIPTGGTIRLWSPTPAGSSGYFR